MVKCMVGILYLENGDEYNGEFKDNKMHGQGTYNGKWYRKRISRRFQKWKNA